MGSYLEKDVSILFKRIGFDVSLNSKEFGFESDVIAKKSGFTILVQTKQYENSYINVEGLLHEWKSKGEHNKVDRILIVISGFNISEKNFDLAKKLGVYLWDEEILEELKEIETNKELYEKIGKLLKFKDIVERLEKEKEEKKIRRAEWHEKVEKEKKEEQKRIEKEREEKIKEKTRIQKRKTKNLIILLGVWVLLMIAGYFINNLFLNLVNALLLLGLVGYSIIYFFIRRNIKKKK